LTPMGRVAAAGFDLRLEVAGRDIGRALEHHMLADVRESGGAVLLVFRADVIRYADPDDGRRMILVEDCDEAVGKGQSRVLERLCGRRGLRGDDGRYRQRGDDDGET